MDENAKRSLICDTGRELLGTGLVARTWGNVSCRLDGDSFLITPSGLGYLNTNPEDIVKLKLSTMEWEGPRKPSSEKGIHAAAYELFDDVGFVIHTHQNAATALGIAGFDAMDISEDEKNALGGIAKAEYGLPGMKKLKNAVRSAFSTGAHVVFMVNHGVVVCGKDKEQAMERVQLLEDICRRNLCLDSKAAKPLSDEKVAKLMTSVKHSIPTAEVGNGEFSQMWAARGTALHAQLDDMAQMLGASVATVLPVPVFVTAALRLSDAVFVKGVGAVVKGDDPDDRDALKLLTEKSALCAIHTSNLGARVMLNIFDTALMRFVYKNKYSKKKG